MKLLTSFHIHRYIVLLADRIKRHRIYFKLLPLTVIQFFRENKLLWTRFIYFSFSVIFVDFIFASIYRLFDYKIGVCLVRAARGRF